MLSTVWMPGCSSAMRLVRFRFAARILWALPSHFVDGLGDWTPWEVVLMWSCGCDRLPCPRHLLLLCYKFEGSILSAVRLDYALVRVRCLSYMQESARADAPSNRSSTWSFFCVTAAIRNCRDTPGPHLASRLQRSLLLVVALAASTLVWVGIATFISCITVWVGRTLCACGSRSHRTERLRQVPPRYLPRAAAERCSQSCPLVLPPSTRWRLRCEAARMAGPVRV